MYILPEAIHVYICCLPTSNCLYAVLLTLGAHAQKGYGTCLVCVCLCVCVSVCLSVCVCLSVTTPVPTSLVSMLKIRYVGVYPRLFSPFNLWIFDKSYCSEVMAICK